MGQLCWIYKPLPFLLAWLAEEAGRWAVDWSLLLTSPPLLENLLEAPAWQGMGRMTQGRCKWLNAQHVIPTLESPRAIPTLTEVPPHSDKSVGRKGCSHVLRVWLAMPKVPLSSENCSIWTTWVEDSNGLPRPRAASPACQALNQLALGPLKQMRVNLPPWVGYANTLYSHALQG